MFLFCNLLSLKIVYHDLVLYSQKNVRFGVRNAISVTLKAGKDSSDVVNEKAQKYVGMFALYKYINVYTVYVHVDTESMLY